LLELATEMRCSQPSQSHTYALCLRSVTAQLLSPGREFTQRAHADVVRWADLSGATFPRDGFNWSGPFLCDAVPCQARTRPGRPHTVWAKAASPSGGRVELAWKNHCCKCWQRVPFRHTVTVEIFFRGALSQFQALEVADWRGWWSHDGTACGDTGLARLIDKIDSSLPRHLGGVFCFIRSETAKLSPPQQTEAAEAQCIQV
jgi:hypothetical protein